MRDGAAGIKPTHLAIIFDKSEHSFRKELYPPYKANRSEPPEDLIPQFPLMRAAVRAFGLAPVEQDGYEADDLIATYACAALRRGADVLIISADKDLMQLVGEGVAMYDPASGEAGAKGAREERKIGIEEVCAYFGVAPEKVVDVQALAGDFNRQCTRRPRHRTSKRRRSSSANMAISKPCSPAQTKSNNRNAERP